MVTADGGSRGRMPVPPPGTGPALAWHHHSYGRLWLRSLALAVPAALVVWLVGGFGSWWGWALLAVPPGLSLWAGRQRLEVGADWFRVKKRWVRIDQLVEVRVEGGGNGTGPSLVLVDAARRALEVSLPVLDGHPDIRDPVLRRARLAVRAGAATNPQARRWGLHP